MLEVISDKLTTLWIMTQTTSTQDLGLLSMHGYKVAPVVWSLVVQAEFQFLLFSFSSGLM